MDALRYFVKTKRVYKPRDMVYESPFFGGENGEPRRFAL